MHRYVRFCQRENRVDYARRHARVETLPALRGLRYRNRAADQQNETKLGGPQVSVEGIVLLSVTLISLGDQALFQLCRWQDHPFS